MAQDATATPTSLGIPKINANVDAPTPNGINAMMDSIDTLVTARIPKPVGPANNDALVWNGASWTNSKLTNNNLSGAAGITGANIAAATVAGSNIVADAALAGNPTTTTQAVDNNTTRIATTAFVIAQSAAAVPLTVGPATASVGSATRFARADHTHKFSTGVWDTTGATSSRLNSLFAFTWIGQASDGVGLLGDNARYGMGPGGDIFGEAADNVSGLNWCMDWDGFNAAGGTNQWRWTAAFTQSGGAMGSGSQTLTVGYRAWPIGGGSVTGITDVINNVSFADGNGLKTFDSGWVSAPTTAANSYSFSFITARAGGSVRNWSRFVFSLQVRTV